jgi:hypothetical protein
MIWGEELSASLDQSAGVVVFHRTELSRTQQLALALADKANTMVEQNEKALDAKLGGATAWSDRTDGKAGDKRGEQTQERRNARARGARGEPYPHYHQFQRSWVIRWGTWRTWGAIRAGAGKPNVWRHSEEPVTYYLVLSVLFCFSEARIVSMYNQQCIFTFFFHSAINLHVPNLLHHSPTRPHRLEEQPSQKPRASHF